MVAGVLSAADLYRVLVEALRRGQTRRSTPAVLGSGRGLQVRVPAPLLDRDLEHGPSLAVGDLELEAIKACRLDGQFTVGPESLLQDSLKVRQVNALAILVEILLVAYVEEVAWHLLRFWSYVEAFTSACFVYRPLHSKPSRCTSPSAGPTETP